MQRRRGTTSPDPEKIPEPLRGPLGGFPVGIPRGKKKTLRASKGQVSSERFSEEETCPLHLRSSSILGVFMGRPCNRRPDICFQLLLAIRANIARGLLCVRPTSGLLQKWSNDLLVTTSSTA